MSASEASRGERQRILEMVQSAAVTPEEGERLLSSLEQRESGSRRCPFCAEEIPAGAGVCPECRTPLAFQASGTATPQTGGGFHALAGLGKFLVVYTFVTTQVAPPWRYL